MKARLIRDSNKALKLLCEDGTIANCTDSMLYSFMMDFKRNISFKDGTEGRWDLVYPDMSMYPGETIAFILKQKQLVINDISPFKKFLDKDVSYRTFLSTEEYAQKYSVSSEMVKVYCRNGRLKGAKKVGRAWVIPDNAVYPVEKRQDKGE